MKIIRPFTGTGAVFFPVGPFPQGTCEFATNKCLEFCYALKDPNTNFDEEIRILESEKEVIYRHFIYDQLDELCGRIKLELDGLQTNLLHWFGSGDCPSKDVKRISTIIEKMAKRQNITQMGFTRNVELWDMYPHIFALTVDNAAETRKYEKKGVLFAILQYRNQTSIMYSPEYGIRGGECGPLLCKDRFDEDLDHYINCRTCLRLNTGCFDRKNT